MLAALSTPEEAQRFAAFMRGIGNVDQLLDQLDQRGLTVGVDRRLRLMALLAQLSSQGDGWLGDRASLRDYLVPALARTNDEQAEIGALVDQWLAQSSGTQPPSPLPGHRPPATETPATIQKIDRVWFYIFWAAIIAAIVFFLFVYFGKHENIINTTAPTVVSVSPATRLTDIARDQLEDIFSRLLFAAAVLVCGFSLLSLRSQTKARLTRKVGVTDLTENFGLSTVLPDWFRTATARRAFDQLKRSRWFEINRIDVTKSVAATVRAAGQPRVVRQLVRERPHYVLLVDRGGDWDHSDLLAQTLEAAIAAADIVYTRYDYVDRPSYLSQVRGGVRDLERLPLSVIGSRHSGERLLILGSGSEFFQPVGIRRSRSGQRTAIAPGTPSAELLHLREFSGAVLLTPKARDQWGATEGYLSNMGLLLTRPNVTGIAAVSEWLAAEPGQVRAKEAIGDDSKQQFPLSDWLARSSMQLSAEIPPPMNEIKDIVSRLQQWAGDDELFTLIAAIAVFHKVEPAFTQILARSLLPSHAGILDLETYSRLLQLPWLRDGHFPEWLRIALANALRPERLLMVRRVQLAILGQLARRDNSRALENLNAVGSSFEVSHELSQRQVDELASRVNDGGLLDAGERVFFTVLKGKQLDPIEDVLRPEAPATMREEIETPDRRRRERFVASILALAVFGAYIEPYVVNAYLAVVGATAPYFARLQDYAAFELPTYFSTLTRILAVSTTTLAGALWIWAALRAAEKPRRIAMWLAWFGFNWALIAWLLAGEPETKSAWVAVVAGFAVAVWTITCNFDLWWRAPNVEEVWDERLRNDDWIASTLGTLLIGLLFVIPICSIVVPEFAERTTDPARVVMMSVYGGVAWSLANTMLRRFLLGSSALAAPGHWWLDLAYGTVVLLSLASVVDASTNIVAASRIFGGPLGSLTNRITLWAPTLLIVPLCWLAAARAILGLKSASGRLARVLTQFTAAMLVLVPAAVVMWYIMLTVDMGDKGFVVLPGAIGTGAGAIYGVWLMMGGVNDATPMPNRATSALRILLVLVLAFQTVWVGVYVAPKPLFKLSGLPITDWGNESQLVFWALLMPCVAVFWPLLRFVALPLDEQSQIRPVSWTLWFSAAVMFVVSSVSLPAPSWLALSGALAPLALPIAVWMAWRWKERATVPLIVGGLPFLFYIDLGWIKFPGGVWPLLAILFWSRFVRDGELRSTLLRREHLGWGELALIMLLLSHSGAFPAGQLLGHNVVLTVQPAWMLTTVALIVGASRMPRGRFAIAVILAAAAYLFANFFQTYLFPRLPFPHYEPKLGFHDYLTLLIALFIVPFVRRAQSSGLAGFLGLQLRTAPVVDGAASQIAASLRPTIVGKALSALDPGTLPFAIITLWTFASIASGLAPSLFLNGPPSGRLETYALPGQDSLALIALAFGIVLALTSYRTAVSIGLGVLALIWLVDTSTLWGNHYASWRLATLPNGAEFGVGLSSFSVLSPAGPRSWASVIVVGGFGLFGFVLPYAIKSPENFSPSQGLGSRLASFMSELALYPGGRPSRPAGASDLGSRK